MDSRAAAIQGTDMKRATLDLNTSNFALERSIERPWFRSFITGLIIFNAAVLGLLTYRHSLPHGFVSALEMVDQAVTYIFRNNFV